MAACKITPSHCFSPNGSHSRAFWLLRNNGTEKDPKFFFGLSSSHSQNISLVQLFEPGFGFQYGSDHPLSITGYPLCFFGRYPPLRAFMSFPSHVKQRPLQHQMISNNAQRYFHLIISLISSRPLQNSSSPCAR